MNRERNITVQYDGKALFREIIEEVWHRGNLAFVREAYAPAFVGNRPSRRLQDLAAYRSYVAQARAAFPDLRIDVHQQMAEGDLVASRYTVRGTHHGELMGIGPSGRPINVEGLVLQRLSGGRIAESWNSWDALGLVRSIAPPAALHDIVRGAA